MLDFKAMLLYGFLEPKWSRLRGMVLYVFLIFTQSEILRNTSHTCRSCVTCDILGEGRKETVIEQRCELASKNSSLSTHKFHSEIFRNSSRAHLFIVTSQLDFVGIRHVEARYKITQKYKCFDYRMPITVRNFANHNTLLEYYTHSRSHTKLIVE
ncbi:hypothetical protein J6590_025583 [Homalodisca vitripennis]|nr:hypothetical protein J6590_025583 [Homalodisca vitripennis]